MAQIIINLNKIADVLERYNLSNDPGIREQVRKLRFDVKGERTLLEAVEYIVVSHQARQMGKKKD
jgi:hypothetical protein